MTVDGDVVDFTILKFGDQRGKLHPDCKIMHSLIGQLVLSEFINNPISDGLEIEP
jgi:hypothetical protein